MIRDIDHVAIAVDSLENALAFWSDILQLDVSSIETVESERVKVALLQVGGSRIELLEATGADSPISRFVAKRGGGLHHLTLTVEDLPTTVEQLRRRGIDFIGEGIREGAGGRPVVFLHPRSASGVLVELVGGATRSPTAMREIAAGSVVLLYLREPQEKMWGVLRRLDASGAVVEGLDLGSFDSWLGELEQAVADEVGVIGPSVLFVPMLRLEKVLLDRSSGGVPSLAERFEQRMGMTVQEAFDRLEPEG